MGGKRDSSWRETTRAAWLWHAVGVVLLAAPALVIGHQDGLGLLPGAEPIRPLPRTVEVDADRAALGEQLFHDPRLTREGRFSCASCHHLASGGDDGRPLGLTRSGEPDHFNTPTLFNVAFNHRYTWRGALHSLEDQVGAALRNPRHGASTWPEVLARLRPDAGYRRAFRRLYPEHGLSAYAVANALATFERSLVTPDSAFDRYLRGDTRALTDQQKKGYSLFKQHGCVSCHQGINVGGNLFQRLGIFEDYFRLRGRAPTEADKGRFTITGRPEDLYVFRVPPLRNVAVTAPYFHDGSAAELAEAVQVMARVQLGRQLADAEVCAIVDFLGTLTGEYQGRSLALPAEPAPC